MKRTVMLALSVLTAACAGGAGSDTTIDETTTTSTIETSTTTTTSAVTTTVAATTTTAAAGSALTVADDGTVTIDWDALQGGVFFAPPGGGADPFFYVHTDPATDGFFFSVEAYTVYGTAWTGQLGTFTIDCSPAGSGICVHFDPDGSGPAGDLGADFGVTGDVEVIQADASGFVAEFSNVVFSDGTTIPGPFTVTG